METLDVRGATLDLSRVRDIAMNFDCDHRDVGWAIFVGSTYANGIFRCARDLLPFLWKSLVAEKGFRIVRRYGEERLIVWAVVTSIDEMAGFDLTVHWRSIEPIRIEPPYPRLDSLRWLRP